MPSARSRTVTVAIQPVVVTSNSSTAICATTPRVTREATTESLWCVFSRRAVFDQNDRYEVAIREASPATGSFAALPASDPNNWNQFSWNAALKVAAV